MLGEVVGATGVAPTRTVSLPIVGRREWLRLVRSA